MIAETLFLLLVGHALADFPLQGDFLAQAKDRHSAIGEKVWPEALTAHALIHGGAVFVVTGSLVLALAETVVHAAIDFAKCEKLISFRQDQLLHILCKCLWVAALAAGVS
ncbi:MAG: DUF3307 domain-containing protein [Dongiaceae bacterium]